MEKKSWNNPKLLELDTIKTETEDCTCTAVNGVMSTFMSSNGNAQKHLCHKTGNGEHAGNDNGVGHFRSIGCPEHGDGNCCCYDVGKHS